mmetsp:Transcript_716/g.2150  ORF Transcript_716/g.2150 Transcript_716/m.2150 type:complete len:453 (-) Transcript_716:466-1824(-)
MWSLWCEGAYSWRRVYFGARDVAPGGCGAHVATIGCGGRPVPPGGFGSASGGCSDGRETVSRPGRPRKADEDFPERGGSRHLPLPRHRPRPLHLLRRPLLLPPLRRRRRRPPSRYHPPRRLVRRRRRRARRPARPVPKHGGRRGPADETGGACTRRGGGSRVRGASDCGVPRRRLNRALPLLPRPCRPPPPPPSMLPRCRRARRRCPRRRNRDSVRGLPTRGAGGSGADETVGRAGVFRRARGGIPRLRAGARLRPCLHRRPARYSHSSAAQPRRRRVVVVGVRDHPARPDGSDCATGGPSRARPRRRRPRLRLPLRPAQRRAPPPRGIPLPPRPPHVVRFPAVRHRLPGAPAHPLGPPDCRNLAGSAFTPWLHTGCPLPGSRCRRRLPRRSRRPGVPGSFAGRGGYRRGGAGLRRRRRGARHRRPARYRPGGPRHAPPSRSAAHAPADGPE